MSKIAYLNNVYTTVVHPRTQKNIRVFKIISTDDIVIGNITIKKDTVGGYVENIDCLENSWVDNYAIVFDNARISNSIILERAKIYGSAKIMNSRISGYASIYGNAVITNCDISGAPEILDHSKVSNSFVKNAVLIQGSAEIYDSIIQDGAIVRDYSIVKKSVIKDTAEIKDRCQIFNCSLSGRYILSGNSTKQNETLYKEENLEIVAPERKFE